MKVVFWEVEKKLSFYVILDKVIKYLKLVKIVLIFRLLVVLVFVLVYVLVLVRCYLILG